MKVRVSADTLAQWIGRFLCKLLLEPMLRHSRTYYGRDKLNENSKRVSSIAANNMLTKTFFSTHKDGVLHTHNGGTRCRND